jgi:phage baseplate assembly protein V
MNLAAKCTIRNVDESSGRQRFNLSGLPDEVLDQVEGIGIFGLASSPVPGASAVVIFPSGNRDNGIVIATDDANYRPRGLQPGEVCIYNSTGTFLLMDAIGNITIKRAANVNIIGGTVNVTGGDVAADGISLKTHVHSDPQGGNTGGPH